MAWNVMEPNGMYLARKDISNKLVILRSDGIPLFYGKRPCLKRIRVMAQGRRVVEVGSLLLGNDKNYYY